jgi:amidase
MANDESYPKATVSDLWKAQAKRTGYSKQILQKWAATQTSTETGREIDALIMPCSPWPASSRYGVKLVQSFFWIYN